MTRSEKFTRAYIAAALWSSTDTGDDGREIALGSLGEETLAEDARHRLERDARAFYMGAEEIIARAEGVKETGDCDRWERAGHDFWLTRNGYGCGFWDGDWPEPEATILTTAAKVCGECDLYVGDDGMIYVL